ncbi:MAG: SDR family oxidoreductase [Bdellovibrionales bacterium]|nr:SDR family oxidoreductase [Bdellovibrionales bacterium]
MHIVITGTSRGIGLELTRQALDKKHTVLAVARQPEESKGLKELKAEHGERLQLLAVELTHPEAPAKIQAAVRTWPQVDLLVNNAGILEQSTSTETFLKSFHINSVVPFQVTTALLPALRKSRQAKAVHVTSMMGSIEDNGSGGYYAYRSSKAALNMINKSLAIDNEWLNTIVIHPGWVQTDMGGKGATTPASESAAGIWKVIEGLTTEDSGAFFDFRGKRLPW